MVATSITAAAAPIIAKAFAEIYEAGKQKFQSHLNVLSSRRAAENLYKKIATVEKVKTIWQIDKPVNFRRFYYPSSVLINDEKIRLDSLEQLASDENYVLQGTIGQGKSTFLRYLCIKELEKGDRFPLFIELRRLSKDMTLRQIMKTNLESLGITKVSDQLVEFLAQTGKMVLLLDAFDEIQPDKNQEVLNEIEWLIENYPEMQIIVTSRPGSGIEHSARFSILRLAPLAPTDHEGFLKKILTDKTDRENLLESISKSTNAIKTLITTPLMLTLLVLAYRSENVIPRQVSEFYESLFLTLISRHDKTKPGYTRHRYTELGDKQLQILFEAFCFSCKSRGLGVIDSDQLYEIVEKAGEFTNIKCTDEAFKNEMTKVACLMIEEGKKLYFIHKSVQEYYTAMFIKRSAEPFAQSIYDKLLTKTRQDWQQELSFLKQIDQYRYDKYFATKGIQEFFDFVQLDGTKELKKLNKKTIEKICQHIEVFFPDSKPHSERAITSMIRWGTDGIPYFLLQLSSTVSSFLLSHLMEIKYEEISANCNLEEPGMIGLRLKKLFGNAQFMEKFRPYLEERIREYSKDLIEKRLFVAQEETRAKDLVLF